jgi:putative ABC transport system permease protein
MLKNHIQIAFRNLLKYKGYSFINILGLAIGITCCLSILLFVQDELSYDRFHKNNIYRIGIDGSLRNNPFQAVVTALMMVNTCSGSGNTCLYKSESFGFPVMRYNDKVFSEEKFYWADSSYFEVFTVEFLKGDPKTALVNPESVILTEKMAKKYFGSEDPMGKSLNADSRRDYKITGIVKEFPSNSHFHFDFLASMSSYDLGVDQWLNNNFNTFILLREDTDPELLEAKLNDFVIKYVAPSMQRTLNLSFEDLKKGGGKYKYFLQPYNIHLHSNFLGELEPNGDIAMCMFFIYRFIILLIACINFLQISQLHAHQAGLRIGVRKTLGSSKQQP